MVAGGKDYNLPLAANFGCSAFATCFAEVATLPLDTAKVRLQLQSSASAAAQKYRGMAHTIGVVAREEGLLALWKGIGPGMQRQVLYGGLRIGAYEPVRNAICRMVGQDEREASLGVKIIAGLLTGAGAIAIASPTDLVKVRMQSQGQNGSPIKYRNSMHAYRTIVREEGVGAMWNGVVPNMTRNAVINAAELATYDQIKQMLIQSGLFQDNTPCHLVAGLGAGFCAVAVGSPVDVVKSRMMGDSQGIYAGTLDCFVKTMRNDGPLAFYKGFMTNFARLGSWNVIMFLALEQARKTMAPVFAN